MTEKYIDLAQKISLDWGYISSEAWSALSWLDDHPEACPGRTITESGLKGLLDRNRPDGSGKVLQNFLRDLGITVVPDPEPTNAEKLADLIDKSARSAEVCGITRLVAGELSEQLDRLGVKAPGGDEEKTERDRAWWIENANVTDAEDCEACGEAEDLCPVHHGMAVGIELVTKKIAALGDDPELFNSIPNPPTAPGADDE